MDSNPTRCIGPGTDDSATGRDSSVTQKRRDDDYHLNDLATVIHSIAVSKGWWGPTQMRALHHANRTVPDAEGYRRAWKGENRGMPEVLALIHSEVTEVLEEHRNGHKPTETYYRVTATEMAEGQTRQANETRANEDGSLDYRLNPHLWDRDDTCGWHRMTPDIAPSLGFDMKPEGVPTEMADIIIRVLDAACAYGIDIDKAIAEKVAYNRTRPYKHGGKVC